MLQGMLLQAVLWRCSHRGDLFTSLLFQHFRRESKGSDCKVQDTFIENTMSLCLALIITDQLYVEMNMETAGIKMSLVLFRMCGRWLRKPLECKVRCFSIFPGGATSHQFYFKRIFYLASISVNDE